MSESLGEYRVGITFNPSNNAKVDEIKEVCAEAIDLIDAIEGDGEVQRLKALAITHIEDGAMWGVKAATKKVRDTEVHEAT